MTRLVGAELLKLRTTRTFWALAASAVALVLLIVVLTLIIDDRLETAADVRSLIAAAGVAGLLTMVLGVVAAAGEYRHGTIASTLLVTPQRLRAVSAAVGACLLGGIAIGAAVSLLTAAIALPWASAKGAELPAAGATFELLLGTTMFAGLAAALGAAWGALLRNQVGALVSVLGLLFVVDPTLASLVDAASPYTLSGLSSAINGDDSSAADTLPRGVAALVWAGYTVAIAALAAWMTSRRDI